MYSTQQCITPLQFIWQGCYPYLPVCLSWAFCWGIGGQNPGQISALSCWEKTMAWQHIENGLHSDTTCPKQNWQNIPLLQLKLHPLHCHTGGLHYKWCLPCYTGSYSCWRHNWRGNTWVFIRECTTTLLTSLVVMVRLQELQGLLGVCSHLLLHTTQRSKVDGCLSPNSGLLALFSFTTCGTNLCMDIALQVTNEDVNKARQGIISFSESVSQLWRKI